MLANKQTNKQTSFSGFKLPIFLQPRQDHQRQYMPPGSDQEYYKYSGNRPRLKSKMVISSATVFV